MALILCTERYFRFNGCVLNFTSDSEHPEGEYQLVLDIENQLKKNHYFALSNWNTLDKYRNKIEEYGTSMEEMGLSPVAARVYIYLLFSKEEDATFEEIINFFKFSKSAVSNALKTLSAGNMIESKIVDGQRKRYFEVNFDKMLDHDEMTSRFRTYYLMLDDIRKQRGRKDRLASGLSYASGLYKLMMTEYPLILERWIKMNEKDKRSS